MAKSKNEYPQNKHISARITAIGFGLAAAAGTLRNVEMALEKFPDSNLKSLILEQVKDAIEDVELAVDAMSGE